MMNGRGSPKQGIGMHLTALAANVWRDKWERGRGVEEQFIPLFRGTLTDWQMAGNSRFHIIDREILESEGGPGILWYTQRVFADFVLSVDWRLFNLEDNSGVYLRFPPLGHEDPEHDWQLADRQGYEVQIDDRGYDPDTKTINSPLHLTGAVYKLAPARTHASRPVGEWNAFMIEAQGHRLAVKLNSDPVSELLADGSRLLAGHIGLQAHHAGSRVQFRNIRIREL